MSKPTAPKTTAIAIGCVLAAWLWCFADVVLFGHALAFRDTAHYYFPQFTLLADEISQGRLPHWNPYLNTGVPLLATGNSGMFYPPLWLALIFPGNTATVWSLFVSAHVALAAGSAWCMARGFGCSGAAAGLAALAYAFGGAVLFQYANVVYLIGAAWLPLAVLGIERVRNGPTTRDVATLGTALAMIVLGGDPQLAYHVGILALLRLCLSAQPADRAATRGRAALGLTSAAAVALSLAAVQWLPSYALAHTSDRAIESVVAEDTTAAAVTGPLTPHAAKRYWFSVGPWRLAELFVPNLSGQMFPRHQRWLEALPAESHPWTASLYMGIVPLLLAGATWRHARRNPRIAWLWAVAAFAALASFGRYGLGWCGEELGLIQPTDWDLPDDVRATGGLYWLLSQLLPGYDAFRYPAKWTVVAAVAIAALAAFGFDRLLGRQADGNERVCAQCWFAFGGVALVAAALLKVMRGSWSTWGAHVPADPLFGPFDADGAGWGLVFSLVQLASVSVTVGLLIQRRARLGQTAAVVVLCVTAFDLALAAGPLVATVPSASGVFDTPFDRLDNEPRARRTLGSRQLPTPWRDESSDDRLSEWLRWQRTTGQPNWNLIDRTPVGIVSPAVWPYAAKAHFRASIEHGAAPLSGGRVWLSDEVVRIDTINETSADQVRRRSAEVLDLLSAQTSAARLAVVETDTSLDEWTDVAPADRSGTAHIVAETTDRVDISVELTRPGVLVLADLYTPDWHATIETDDVKANAEVLRVNRIMRGVALPAGQHRVTFVYRPTGFTIGAIVSGLAWTALLATTLWSLRQT